MIDVKLLETKLKKRRMAKGGEEIVFLCPFCEQHGLGPDRRGHLYVNSITGNFICHRCGERGSYKTLLWLLKLPYSNGSLTPDVVFFKGLQDFNQLHAQEVIKSAFDTFQALTNEHEAYKYLLSRGLTDNDIKLYNFGIFTDKAHGYVIAPVIFKGNWVAWQGRWYKSTPNKRKYFNPPDVKLHDYVYNYDLASLYKTAVLVEGVFDAISVGHNGIATFGKTLSKQQLYLITTTWAKVIVAYDRDATDDIQRIARNLSSYIDVYVFDWSVFNESVKDFNELLIQTSREYVRSVIEKYSTKFT